MGDWSFAGGVRANPELYSRYEVLERLGEGTYGEVFKGKRKLDGLVVALKETRDPQCATREAEALLALNHPNVVRLFEYFVQGANLILVLEFLPLDLYRVVDGSHGRIPEAQVKGWMLHILRGVAACHQASILHRDLKPSNLLVGADGSVKVADFGQARVVLPQSADLLGINETIFERDEVTTTYKEKKEVISVAQESTEMKAAGPSEGLEADYAVGQCFCVTNEKEGKSGTGDESVVGCRSLNCSMVKREGLIVARSNHFVELEQNIKNAHDEERGRREWVLAEKNMVNSVQEKDGDFFCKLRSFLKRRGRKPQKHFRWGRDKNDTERSQMIMEEDGGRLDYLDQEPDTAHVLQESAVREFIPGQQQPSPFSVMSGSTLSKEIEAGKPEVEHLENVGLRPLMGTGSTEEEIVFRGLERSGSSCLFEKSSKRSTFDLKESEPATTPYQPPVENPFDGTTYTTQLFGDSGRISSRDDTGSESKRRKAYELAEEIVSTDLDIGPKIDQDSIVDMETDKRTSFSELEAVRNRILHGKHRKREPPPLQSSIDFQAGEFEPPATPTGGKGELTEETEKAVRVLGLERVHNGAEREVECAQEPAPSNKEGTIRFWDGDRQRWESPYASDEDTGDPFNSKWFAGGNRNGVLSDDGSCPVDQVPGYYGFGDSELEESDPEEGDTTCQTRWYGPPDVRDSYVKGKLDDEYVYGERVHHDSEVHSEQQETESTCSSEKGSNLSPFVGTRWYKGPELLYGATKYGKGLDMWAVGCIFAELLAGKPLFPGISDIDQLSRIVRVLGAPNETAWPGVSSLPDFDKISFTEEQRDPLALRKLLPQASPSALKFLEKLLVLDPDRRISAEDALKDAYFVEEPLPVITHDLKLPSFRGDSSASEEWGDWRDPGSPFSDFEILDSAL